MLYAISNYAIYTILGLIVLLVIAVIIHNITAPFTYGLRSIGFYIDMYIPILLSLTVGIVSFSASPCKV